MVIYVIGTSVGIDEVIKGIVLLLIVFIGVVAIPFNECVSQRKSWRSIPIAAGAQAVAVALSFVFHSVDDG